MKNLQAVTVFFFVAVCGLFLRFDLESDWLGHNEHFFFKFLMFIVFI